MRGRGLAITIGRVPPGLLFVEDASARCPSAHLYCFRASGSVLERLPSKDLPAAPDSIGLWHSWVRPKRAACGLLPVCEGRLRRERSMHTQVRFSLGPACARRSTTSVEANFVRHYYEHAPQYHSAVTLTATFARRRPDLETPGGAELGSRVVQWLACSTVQRSRRQGLRTRRRPAQGAPSRGGVHDHRPRSPFSRPALSGRVPSRAGDSEVGKEGARSTELRAQYGAARAVGGSAVRIRSRSWPRCDRAATWGLGLPQKPPQVARCVLRPARMSSRTGKCLSFVRVAGAYSHSPLRSAAPAARSRTALMLHYPRALTCA